MGQEEGFVKRASNDNCCEFVDGGECTQWNACFEEK